MRKSDSVNKRDIIFSEILCLLGGCCDIPLSVILNI